MTIALGPMAGGPRSRWHSLPDRVRAWRAPARPTVEQALLRALCHDLGTPLVSLRALLDHTRTALDSGPDEALELACAQTDHLLSMLRTAAATVDAAPASNRPRPLSDVVLASLAASGLPARQVDLHLDPGTSEVQVADARVQRILVNLLENAHRHGAGRPVTVRVQVHPGRVRVSLTQAGVPARVAEHLRAGLPPPDLTGLGLWSAQRQATELGGRVHCSPAAEGTRTIVDLPDR
ncbi:MAG: ATP-binding region ATPase domain protein, partial [Klenkia sp.]|nr:ATP-binding region ATPase domain protein [Klenkia sp.]